MIVGQEPFVVEVRVTITLASQVSDAVTSAGAGQFSFPALFRLNPRTTA